MSYDPTSPMSREAQAHFPASGVKGHPQSPDLSDTGAYATPEDAETAAELGISVAQLRTDRAADDQADAARGPVVNGEQFAPGYTPEAAAYEQASRAWAAEPDVRSETISIYGQRGDVVRAQGELMTLLAQLGERHHVRISVGIADEHMPLISMLG